MHALNYVLLQYMIKTSINSSWLACRRGLNSGDSRAPPGGLPPADLKGTAAFEGLKNRGGNVFRFQLKLFSYTTTVQRFLVFLLLEMAF